MKAAVTGVREAEEEEREERTLAEFFESYESSYALTLNYPDEILIETARMQGIEVEGREKIDIVKDMFIRKESADHGS